MATQPSLFDADPTPMTETPAWLISCAACGGEIARTIDHPGDGGGPGYTVRAGTLEEPAAQAGHTETCPALAPSRAAGDAQAAENRRRRRRKERA